jgi:hypothetical protein
MSAHEMTYRVPYADTDQMDVVYYANYLVYFERSRTEMLRDAGFPYIELDIFYQLPKWFANIVLPRLMTICLLSVLTSKRLAAFA